MSAKVNFVKQQGFPEASSESCSYQFPALMWQPRLTGVLVVIALALQSAPLFLAMSAVLWWNVLFPALNPFDALYNLLVARPKQRPPLTPAPAPRRFAQAVAATFMLGIGLSLWFEVMLAAWILEGFLIVALSALIFGGFCLGSYFYWLVARRPDVANHTLPWSP